MLLKTSYKMKPPPSVRLRSGHPLADKLIACYLFNEGSGYKILDSSGRGHTGTRSPGTGLTTGKFGPAISFNGTNGHIVIDDHADFTPALHPFSISAWVYMQDATNFVIASKGVYTLDKEWNFRVESNDKLYFHLRDNSNGARIGRIYSSTLTTYENQWICLVATYDGGTSSSGIKLYVNGIRVDDTDYNALAFESVEDLGHAVWIGRYDTTYANGVIDNIMFWRRVLTASDIARLHTQPFCMFAGPASPLPRAIGAA